MNKDLKNKAAVLFAQGDLELNKAYEADKIKFDGKVRTCSRRASGFYLDALLTVSPKEFYGKSFMSHLRGILSDNSVPQKVKDSAKLLLVKASVKEISGAAAINSAKIIMDYCKSEFEKVI